MIDVLSRRDFLTLLGVAGLSTAVRPAARRMQLGCAAITWGGDDTQAIEDIASVGYKGIQLRASVLSSFDGRPDDLRALLKKHKLTFAVLSSGNLVIDPAAEQDQLALHTAHAEFVRRAHGKFIQVIDERPKGRPVTAQDYTRVGRLLTELGKRTAAAGVPLVYHHHMNSTGERPEEIAAILEAANPAHVGLLFDIAHYQQGGGDPVTAIRTYRNWIKVVHLKDVRPIDAAPGYQWAELGRGRVDVKACVAALREIGFDGWAIVELDRVTDPGETPKGAAAANARYAKAELGLAP
jgi:inosose dehydratase